MGPPLRRPTLVGAVRGTLKCGVSMPQSFPAGAAASCGVGHFYAVSLSPRNAARCLPPAVNLGFCEPTPRAIVPILMGLGETETALLVEQITAANEDNAQLSSNLLK